MSNAGAFGSFVPGFDFLQNLVKNAGSALPSMGQWIVPSLDPEELDRRIKDLRTVQFWLEQNSRMLATTIQALEVQRMTLGTLKGMNVTLSDLQEALRVKPFEAAAAAAPQPAPAPGPEPAAAADDSAAEPAPAGVVDAMKWWGALTQQFSDIASQAMEATAQAGAQASAAMADATSAGAAAAGLSKAASGAPSKSSRQSPKKPSVKKTPSKARKTAANARPGNGR